MYFLMQSLRRHLSVLPAFIGTKEVVSFTSLYYIKTYHSTLCWPGWVRSNDLLVNSQTLLPTELLASITYYLIWSGVLGSRQANRLDIHSVIATTPHGILVPSDGFEPPTLCLQSICTTAVLRGPALLRIVRLSVV